MIQELRTAIGIFHGFVLINDFIFILVILYSISIS